MIPAIGMSRAAAAALTALQSQGGGTPPEELLGVPDVISLDHIDPADLRYGLRVQVVGASLTASVTVPEGGDLTALQDRYFILPAMQRPTENPSFIRFGYWYNLNELVGDEPTVAEGQQAPDYWIRVDIAVNYTADNIRIQTVNSNVEVGPSVQDYWDMNLPENRITWTAKARIDTEDSSVESNIPEWDMGIYQEGVDADPFEFVCTNPDAESPEWMPVGPLHLNLFGAEVTEYGKRLLGLGGVGDFMEDVRLATDLYNMADDGYLTLGDDTGSAKIVTSDVNTLNVGLEISCGRTHTLSFDWPALVQFVIPEGYAPLPAFFNDPVLVVAGDTFRFTGVGYLDDEVSDHCERYIIERFTSLGAPDPA